MYGLQSDSIFFYGNQLDVDIAGRRMKIHVLDGLL